MADNPSLTASFFAPWDGNGAIMAADLGEKHVTVNQWRHRDNIPPKYWPIIIAKAKARGFELTLEQFAAAFLPSVEADAA